ncbi:MAG: fumarylacetoacetate hydrolase family protein [Eubacteriales bacterium]|nr:fumarylacetoacetate hydrolase family protein [Eubacteriales bacterium]
MKFANLLINGDTKACVFSGGKWLDISEQATMDEIVAGKKTDPSIGIPVAGEPVFGNILNTPGKLLCVGLNYRSHADKVEFKRADTPILFSKFANALVPSDSKITLPEWESSYDYEAELVIVMGSEAWNVSEEDAMKYVFGYTAGNDMSIRDPQKRTSQWLIGKTMPGFGPCGPCIVTADELDPVKGASIKSYVNGEMRQNGSTSEMIFSCAEIISYASKYIKLEPGDLIFTGTPSGVGLEKEEKIWLKPGDTVDVEIEKIGILRNYFI